jgi:hypothetical protein
MLARFNRLIGELLRGNLTRNCFRPWEVELLLDIESCTARESGRRELLKRYQRAVQRSMEKGARRPYTMSEYLDANKARQNQRLGALANVRSVEAASAGEPLNASVNQA